MRVSFKDDDGNSEMLTSAAATIEGGAECRADLGRQDRRDPGGQALRLRTDDFTFTDADAGEKLQSVVAVTVPPEGTLTFNTRAVNPGRRMPEENIGNGYLVYIPPTNGNGDALTSFTLPGERRHRRQRSGLHHDHRRHAGGRSGRGGADDRGRGEGGRDGERIDARHPGA